MAYSYTTYTGNGSTTQFTVPFGYVRKEHVFVEVNDVNTSFTWVNATTVNVSPAPANGAAVVVKRVTPVSSRLVDYTDGSTLVAADLDTDSLQHLYTEQELTDSVGPLSNLRALYYGAYTTDPTVDPFGQALDEGDLYFNTTNDVIRVYNGTQWQNAVNSVSYQRWKKTAAGGETSLSGADDSSQVLTYTAGFEQVYLNGALLTRGVDYTATNGSTITGLVALTASDIVEVIGFNRISVNSDSGLINFLQVGAGAVSRTVESKLRDIINVRDYGVVGDGTTDNTSAYTSLVSAVSAGSTIYWPPGTYVGTFYSTKALNLIGGPSVVLKAASTVSTTAIIRFEGSLGSYQNLSAAPAWGNITLSGVAGLAAGDLVLLYSGSLRPGDNAPVNYEMVRMLTSTAVEGQVMSVQSGGTPQYAKVTPLKDFTIEGFRFDLGTTAGTASNAVAAVWIRYSENITVRNVHATGGYGSTVRIDGCYDVQIDNSSRIRPYDTGSGNGYHIALGHCTNLHATEIRGVQTRHTFDADSCYFLSLRNCLSQSGISSDIVMTHNGFGGGHTYENIRVIDPEHNTYSIHTSVQGIAAADLTNQVARDFKIYNLRSIRRENPTAQAAAIYFQYSSSDINIQDVAIENPVGTSFADQMAIRFSGPIFGKSSIIGCRISSYDWGIYLANDIVTNPAYPRHSDQLTVRDISCYRVKTPIYDDIAATDYLYLDVANIQVENSNSYGFDCFMRISRLHGGQTFFTFNQYVTALENTRNKIVVNTSGHNVIFKNDIGGTLSSSLSPASNTLTQGNMVTAGEPTGRILNASTITTVDKPCGSGQSVLFLCNGSVSISDAATVVGTITASANETIRLISNGSTWRKVDTPGSW